MANVQSISNYDVDTWTRGGFCVRYIYLYIYSFSKESLFFFNINLGDVFDEGQWCSSTEFENYIQRFNSLFYVPKDTRLYVVAGNHDMGFHYGRVVYKNTSSKFV